MRTHPPKGRLRLLATTDLHGRVRDHDYTRNSGMDWAGLVRTAPLIRQARTEAEASILMDNGDFLFGTAFTDLELGEDFATLPHPMVAAMNALAYDVVNLGNHDLDHGLAALDRAVANALFPVISANLDRTGASREAAVTAPPDFVLLYRDIALDDGTTETITVGVTGVLPPQMAIWQRHRIGNRIATRDMRDALRETVPKMRTAGADIVVALVHGGVSQRPYRSGMEHSAGHIAALPGIDVVIAGHSHRIYPRGSEPSCDPVPLVEPGFWGSHLAIVDLDLSREANKWTVAQSMAELRAVKDEGSPADPALLRLSQPRHDATVAALEEPIGTLDARLHSYFDRLGASRILALGHAIQRDWAANALTDEDAEPLPLLSAFAPGRAGGFGGPQHFTDIANGSLTRRSLGDILPFDNQLTVIEVEGRSLREWLDHSAGCYHELRPDTPDQPLIDSGRPSYNCDHVSGADYRIDLMRPRTTYYDGRPTGAVTSRIERLSVAGQSVAEADRFHIVTNTYRAGGGGGFSMLPDCPSRALSTVSFQDLAMNWLRRNPALPRATNTPLTASVPCEATFATGIASADLLGDIGVPATYLGPTSEGFGRIRLRFGDDLAKYAPNT